MQSLAGEMLEALLVTSNPGCLTTLMVVEPGKLIFHGVGCCGGPLPTCYGCWSRSPSEAWAKQLHRLVFHRWTCCGNRTWVLLLPLSAPKDAAAGVGEVPRPLRPRRRLDRCSRCLYAWSSGQSEVALMGMALMEVVLLEFQNRMNRGVIDLRWRWWCDRCLRPRPLQPPTNHTAVAASVASLESSRLVVDHGLEPGSGSRKRAADGAGSSPGSTLHCSGWSFGYLPPCRCQRGKCPPCDVLFEIQDERIY